MPQFEMEGRHLPEFNALDDFTRGYIQAIFWVAVESQTVRPRQADESAEDFRARRGSSRVWDPQRAAEGQESELPGDYGFADLALKALQAIVKDCAEFQKRMPTLLQAVTENQPKHGRPYDMESAGIDFWLTRNGHGTGFWDKDFADVADIATGKEIGKALSEAAERFGESNVYLGDDGKVYLS